MDDLDKFYDELMVTRNEEPTRGTMWWGNYVEAVLQKDIGDYWAWYPPRNTRYDNDIVYRDKEQRIHRLSGPAYINYNMSSEEWWREGQLHREDGPAITCKQLFIWAQHGNLHNIDGPAVVDPAGPCQYWIDGVRYSPKQFKIEATRRKRKAMK